MLTFKVREKGVGFLWDVLYHRLKNRPIDVVSVDALNCRVKDELLLQLVRTEKAADADGPRQF